MSFWCTVAWALGAVGCAPDELPVVSRGRYVEIATDRDDPVCGGTAAYFDRFLEAGFALIGEEPPDRVFVRFEWRRGPDVRDSPFAGDGAASMRGDHILLRSSQILVHEHELAHAVHLTAWPKTNRFLYEGFAVLLDAKRFYDPAPWTKGLELDEIIAGDWDETKYPMAYYLVSQIVYEHGWDGLKKLWHAIPQDSSAAEVRAAYTRVFGDSMEVLLQPEVIELAEVSYEQTRLSCDFAVCPMPPEGAPFAASNPEPWIAPGPTDCEDDPNAVGPSGGGELISNTGFYGDVWRAYTLVTGDVSSGPWSNASLPDVATFLDPCALTCDGTRRTVDPPGPSANVALPIYSNGRYRIEVRARSSDLPTDEPGAFTLTPMPP